MMDLDDWVDIISCGLGFLHPDEARIRNEYRQQEKQHNKDKLLFFMRLKADEEKHKQMQEKNWQEFLRPTFLDDQPTIIDATYQDVDVVVVSDVGTETGSN